MLTITLILTFIFGFLGMLVESAQSSITQKKLVYKGDRFFYNFPAIFIYGAGGLLFYLVIKASGNLPWYETVLVLTLVASAWEYIGGYFCDKVIEEKFWDYSDRKYNLHGYISLWSVMWWFIFACIFYFSIFERLHNLEIYLNSTLVLTANQDRLVFLSAVLVFFGIIAKRTRDI